MNTSTSTAAKSTTTSDTKISRSRIQYRKRIAKEVMPNNFKPDPYNSDPYRFTKRRDLDYKYHIKEEKERDLGDHFIRSIDKKRRFAYEQRYPDDLAIRDKKSKLGDELRPYGLTAPKLT